MIRGKNGLQDHILALNSFGDKLISRPGQR
jgi:hypothetical protein